MKLQCIVTSYCRPTYLEACLKSLRQDDGIELCVVDGGSDEKTLTLINQLADRWLFLENNPGADALKNAGIREFVTAPEFMITSDDLVFPAGWRKLLTTQYARLNAKRLEFAMVACPLPAFLDREEHYYTHESGVRIMGAGRPMVSGAMMDCEATKRVGGFPEMGKTGLGDRLIGPRLAKIGLKGCYLHEPVLEHIGATKAEDYPEYTRAYNEDAEAWWDRSNTDNWVG